MSTYAGYRPESVTWNGDTAAAYASSPGVTRRFCPTCGTSLTFESTRWPDEVHLFVATMNDPDAFEPDRHVYMEDRIAWMHMADGLPRFQQTSGRAFESRN
jgi:hypothetical protein